jgi:hypothetical protein
MSTNTDRQTDRQTDTHMREVVMPQAMSWSSLGLKRGSPRASGRTMSLPVLAAYLHMQLTKDKKSPVCAAFTHPPFPIPSALSHTYRLTQMRGSVNKLFLSSDLYDVNVYADRY